MSDLKLTNRDMEIISKVFQCFQSADAMKIDTDKLASLAGFSNGKSANASWLVIKKKLMNGATVDTANTVSTPKKTKGKAAANGDADDDDEATPTVAAPKKRGKAIKSEPADAEGGDADTEKTPSAEPPKKGRAKKGAAASKTEVNGDAINDPTTTEGTTPAPKRKRGPNKPKDPNATPTKRAKKGVKAGTLNTTEANDDSAAKPQLQADDDVFQTVEGGSLFGGDAMLKTEDADVMESDDRPFDEEDKGMFNNTYTEDQVA